MGAVAVLIGGSEYRETVTVSSMVLVTVDMVG
jgi:hypothetical protein